MQKSSNSETQKDPEVYVYTRPAEGVPALTEGVMHWILVIKFADETFISFEANRKEGKLVPSFGLAEPQNFSEKNKYYIGTAKTSLEEMINFAFGNPLSNKAYEITEINCQEWVLELAKELKLDPKVRQKLKTAGGLKGVAVGIAAVAGLGSVLGSTASVLSRKRKRQD